MKHDFWHARWAEGRIGFHQNNFNAWLLKYWRLIGAPSGSAVLVPLCGKSKDMLWIREQGYPVVGVELSDIACRDFFFEQGVEVTAVTEQRFHARERDGIRLLCGDFMDLDSADIEGVRSVYDRAALIALPSEMRVAYATKLKSLLTSGDGVLLVALEYDTSKDNPPFAVFESEVRRLFEPAFTVEVLDFADIETAKYEGEREVVYRLTRQ